MCSPPTPLCRVYHFGPDLLVRRFPFILLSPPSPSLILIGIVNTFLGSLRVHCVSIQLRSPLYMSLKRKFQPAFFENNITMGAKQSNMSAAQKQQYHPAQKRAKPRSSSTASNTAATRHNNKPTQPVANPM